ncbi:hypothetical protein NEPAR06_2535, partial [Nematocida parisii]
PRARIRGRGGRGERGKPGAGQDSRPVAMEVGSRQEVCRNFPAEPVRAEKGGRWKSPRRRATLRLTFFLCVRSGAARAQRSRAATRRGAPARADLGGSSGLGAKGRRGEGFPRGESRA